MIIRDRLYGQFKITEPVIVKLISSSPVQRLKRIAQYGIPDEFYFLKNPTRYDHSIGVMLLLRKFGASVEEQIAGLLHDASHTAFSHVIDVLMGSAETESFQDEQHEAFILGSDLAKALRKYGYNPKKIAAHENFSLLEQPIPLLCADRLDYSLREMPTGFVRQVLKNLIVHQGKFVFKDKERAVAYAIRFLQHQSDHWGNFEAVARYNIFGKALKIGLEDKTFDLDDFWKHDSFIVNKLKKSKNYKIMEILDLLRRKNLRGLVMSPKIYKKKFRYVDPYIYKNDRLTTLSKLDKNFSRRLEMEKKRNKKGVRIPLI